MRAVHTICYRWEFCWCALVGSHQNRVFKTPSACFSEVHNKTTEVNGFKVPWHFFVWTSKPVEEMCMLPHTDIVNTCVPKSPCNMQHATLPCCLLGKSQDLPALQKSLIPTTTACWLWVGLCIDCTLNFERTGDQVVCWEPKSYWHAIWLLSRP